MLRRGEGVQRGDIARIDNCTTEPFGPTDVDLRYVPLFPEVHNFAAKQTIFAFNNWKAGPGADLGIGNSDPNVNGGRTLDWTFNGNASQYVVKRLKVLVRLEK